MQGITVAERKSLGGKRVVSKPYTEIIRSLLARGADVNAKSKDGGTVLIRAARVGDVEIIKLLIQNGADINAKNNKGQTALMYAYAIAYARLKASPNDPFVLVPVNPEGEIEMPSIKQEDKDLLVKSDEIVRLLKEAGAQD